MPRKSPSINRKDKTASPYLCTSSSRPFSGSSRASAYPNSHSRSKIGTEIVAGPSEGGRATERTIPVWGVTLSTKPEKTTRVPLGKISNAWTGTRSESNFDNRLAASSEEITFLFMAEQWSVGHAKLWAKIIGFDFTSSDRCEQYLQDTSPNS
jgi:hypothetical protein